MSINYKALWATLGILIAIIAFCILLTIFPVLFGILIIIVGLTIIISFFWAVYEIMCEIF